MPPGFASIHLLSAYTSTVCRSQPGRTLTLSPKASDH